MPVEFTQPPIDCPDSSLSFERVICVLNDALRLFGEGDEERACQCLSEANSIFDSCLAGGSPDAGVRSISVVNSAPRRSVEVEEEAEEAVLATIA